MRKLFLIIAILVCFSGSAQQNWDSLLKIIPTIKDKTERIRVMYKMLADASKPQKQIYYHQKLLEIARKTGDKVGEAVAYSELGFAMAASGNTVEGLKIAFDAVQMAEDTKDEQAIGIAYDNLSGSYLDVQKQKQYLLKALTASEAANDHLFVCYELDNLYNVYLFEKKRDSAIYYNGREMEVATTHHVEEMIPTAMVSAGNLEYILGRKTVALEYYRSALKEPFTAKDIMTQTSVYRSLTWYFIYAKNYDSSLYYARKNYESSLNGYYEFQLTPSYALWHLYANNIKNSDSALKYSGIYYSIKDSISSNQKVVQMQALVLLNEQREELAKEEHSRNIQYAAIALGTVALTILFFLFSHTVIANQKLIRSLGVLSLLIFFEFINLVIHPYLEKYTHHSVAIMLLVMVFIAALLIPLHHQLEHWITHKLVEKNKKIRLAAAKKTIQQLEGENS